MVTCMRWFSWSPRHLGVVADLILAGLLIGPLLAAAFSHLPFSPLSFVAEMIYVIGTFVCPQPSFGLPVSHGHIMAVCMRCYGTVAGILITRLLYAAGGFPHVWLPRWGVRGLPLFALLIFAYPAELAGQVADLWHFDHLVVSLVGLITGVGLGLMFHPFLHSYKHFGLLEPGT